MTDTEQIHSTSRPPACHPKAAEECDFPSDRRWGDHGVGGSVSIYVEDRLQGSGLGPFKASMPVTSLALSPLILFCLQSLALHSCLAAGHCHTVRRRGAGHCPSLIPQQLLKELLLWKSRSQRAGGRVRLPKVPSPWLLFLTSPSLTRKLPGLLCNYSTIWSMNTAECLWGDRLRVPQACVSDDMLGTPTGPV